MIISFSFSNFFSFKEGAAISFEQPKSAQGDLTNDKDIARVIAIKGNNASGKTNIIRALSFLKHFCTNSFQDEPENPLLFEPFYDSPEPTEFEVEFTTASGHYKYNLTATDKAVIKEVIYRKKTKFSKIIEREFNKITDATINEFTKLREMALRDNASLISTSRYYSNIENDTLREIYNFFNWILSNVSYIGYRPQLFDLNTVCKVYHEHKDLLDFTKNIIKKCDTGIVDIIIHTRKDEETGKTSYYPLFIHEANGKQHSVTQATESNGTKSLFLKMMDYAFAIRTGAVLCIDEFDSNLHPHILAFVVETFITTENNNAQLLFTSHNSEILDYLGKYRTYLVNKENNESYCYRLDELPTNILRNDRPIAPLYNSGKIGGVPSL